MDLKVWKNCSACFLVLVDIVTRYCTACVIVDKKLSTVIKALFGKWISLFGPPHQIFSDNGGEFNINNELMRDLGDSFWH